MTREITHPGQSTPVSPVGTDSGDEPQASTTSFDLMPMPSLVSDPLAELEALLIQMRLNDRASARQENLVERHAIERAGLQQVKELLERAEDVWTEGLYGGLGQMFGGALTATGGGIGLTSGTSTSELTEGRNWSQLLAGIGTSLEGLGGVGAAHHASAQVEHDSNIADAQTAQEIAEQNANQTASDMDDARQALRALLRQIQQIHEAEQAAQQAALFTA